MDSGGDYLKIMAVAKVASSSAAQSVDNPDHDHINTWNNESNSSDTGLLLASSPTPPRAKKPRKRPRKSVAPTKVLSAGGRPSGPPVARSLCRSPRKRHNEDAIQTFKALSVVVPSASVAFRVNLEDFNFYVDSTHPPASADTVAAAPSSLVATAVYNSPTHNGRTSPPKSILRSKKKPRVDVNDNGTDDAQLDALVITTASTSISTPVETKADVIEVDDLLYRMSLLFPETYKQSQTVPCILPRLVACYTLHRDKEVSEGTDDSNNNTRGIQSSLNPRAPKVTTRRRKRSLDAKTVAIHDLAPVGDFLKSLVDLELSLLSNRGADADLYGNSIFEDESSNPSPHSRVRKVHFASFDTPSDGSAVLCPPTDTLEGSQQSQEECIQKLSQVLKTARVIFPCVDSVADRDVTAPSGDRSSAISALQGLVRYLDHDFRLYYHDKVCACSIISLAHRKPAEDLDDNGLSAPIGLACSYPTSRIEKAAAAYSRDLDSLLAYASPLEPAFVDAKVMAMAASADVPVPPPLVWECRLADAAAQLVRFWLRTLINSVPERYEKNPNNSRAWKRRIDDLITLAERPGKEGDEDPTSSLVSNAFSHLYDYLGADTSRWKKRLSEHLGSGPVSALTTFCDSDICRRGIGSGRQIAPPLTDLEWQHVWDQLDSASALLACYSRAVFLDQLLSVVVESRIAPQWSKTVQAAARPLAALSIRDAVLSAHGNSILDPEDAHLALMALGIEELQTQLRTILLPLEDHVKSTHANLLATVKAFRLGGKKSNAKNAHQPHVGWLEDFWLQHLEPSLPFCTVKPTGEEATEDAGIVGTDGTQVGGEDPIEK